MAKRHWYRRLCFLVLCVRKKKSFIMHPYLPHLLEDIKLAYREKSKASDKSPKPTEDLRTELYFDEIERYVSGDDELTFGYYCLLGSEVFPPADQFDESEQEQVCTALENMFSSW